MSEATMVIQVDDELKTAFAQAAEAQDSNSTQVLNEFMRDFVRQHQSNPGEYQRWLQQKIDVARASVAAGHVLTSDEVETHFARRRAASLQKAAASGS